MSLFLTHDEMQELTGYQLPHFQALWLIDHGYPFERTNSGKPRVLRAYIQQRLGLGVISDIPRSSTEPDFSHWPQYKAV